MNSEEMDSDKGCSSSSGKGNERSAAKDDPVLQRLVASKVIHGELYSSDEEFDLPYDGNDELNDDLEQMFFKEQIRNAQKLFFDITKDNDDEDIDDILNEVIKCPVKMSECLAQNTNLKESEILNHLQDILETNSLLRDKLLILEQGLLKKQQELKDALSILEQQDLDLSDGENIEEENEEIVTWGSPFYSPPKDGVVYSENIGIFFNQFEPPYFKTRRGFVCPQNSDAVEERNSSRIRVTDIVYKKPWTSHSLEIFENVLKKCLVEEFKSRPDFKSIYKWREYSAFVKSHTLGEILKEKEFKFDWLRVSVLLGDEENRSASECEKMWNLYMDPKYNKNEWTEDENELIMFLSSYYKEFEWGQIANELASNRSSFQVFVHYQTELRKKRLGGLKWTPEEDDRIKHIVSLCSYGEFISWKKVVYYFEHRSYSQIYSRYTSNLLYDKKGRFSDKEDEVLISSVFEHKLRFKDAVKVMENRRSEQQIRGRVKNVYEFIRSGKNIGEFTLEEDEQLLRLVEEKGPYWKEIAKVMVSRDRTQLRHRYKKLKRKFEDPSFDLEKIDRTRRPVEKFIKRRYKKILNLIETGEDSKVKNKNCLKADLKEVGQCSSATSSSLRKNLEEYFLNGDCFRWYREAEGPPPEDCQRLTSTFTSILGARLSSDNLKEINDDSNPIFHLRDKLRDDLESFNRDPHLSFDPLLSNSGPSLSNNTPSRSTAKESSLQPSPHSVVTLVPPNLLTCSGFTNLLSHCSKEGDAAKYPKVRTQMGREDIEKAKLLWKRRLFQLFLWPAVLSNKGKKNKFTTY